MWWAPDASIYFHTLFKIVVLLLFGFALVVSSATPDGIKYSSVCACVIVSQQDGGGEREAALISSSLEHSLVPATSWLLPSTGTQAYRFHRDKNLGCVELHTSHGRTLKVELSYILCHLSSKEKLNKKFLIYCSLDFRPGLASRPRTTWCTVQTKVSSAFSKRLVWLVFESSCTGFSRKKISV